MDDNVMSREPLLDLKGGARWPISSAAGVARGRNEFDRTKLHFGRGARIWLHHETVIFVH